MNAARTPRRNLLQARHDAQQRAARLAAERPDHGTIGPAQAARPSRIVETIAAGVTAREMMPDTPLDHWERGALLSERQVDAGWELTRAFQAGFPAKRVTASYGAGHGGDTGLDADMALTAARGRYTRWMDQVPHECRHAVARMVRGEFPNMTGGLSYIRQALTHLADDMGLPKDGG